VACNCSLGWQKHTWETLLQKKVKVELTESVLRGGKRCVFKIHIVEQAA
jgi:predicted hydrocarbon binding protein